MHNKPYNDLFALIQKIQIKQEQQKQNGLNNYNIVNVVRKATHEVGMHSNVIYSLINPYGAHFQGDLFLKLFIEHVIEPSLKDNDPHYSGFGEIFDVQAEEATDTNRRVDFTIKSDKYLIGIEMKVNASDLTNQVSDYYDHLLDESDGQEVYIFYLTKYGNDVSPHSLGTLDKRFVKNISFKNEILQWIEASQQKVKHIPNLYEALINYRMIVQKITNQYRSNVVTIEEELMDKANQDKLKVVFELDKKMNLLKIKTLHRFFTELSDEMIKDSRIQHDNTLKDYPFREFNEEKCKVFVENAKNKPRFFGQTYKIGNDKTLFVLIAFRSLCYGLLDIDKLDIAFNQENISNQKFITYMNDYHCAFKNAVNNYDKLVNTTEFVDIIKKYIGSKI